jgi:hypothetical protein
VATFKWKPELYVARFEKKEAFTDKGIDKLQFEIVAWAEVWVVICGREGIADYSHLLSSSHIFYWLRTWRNLYRYSKQGWEYQNKRTRNRYRRHTQSGDSAGNKGKMSSKFKHLGVW